MQRFQRPNFFQLTDKPHLKDQLLMVSLDVTDTKRWEDAYQKAMSKFGDIDVHMNIAGSYNSQKRPCWTASLPPSLVKVT